jgi:hypothetical protein
MQSLWTESHALSYQYWVALLSRFSSSAMLGHLVVFYYCSSLYQFNVHRMDKKKKRLCTEHRS